VLVPLHSFAKSSIISLGSTQQFTVSTSNLETVFEPFAPGRQDKWYVILHFEIWHFQIDNLDNFEKISETIRLTILPLPKAFCFWE
jgi:hypothetical protein